MIVVIVLALAGLALSLYSFFIEQRIKQDPSYRPMCDFSDRASCSKPILSGYGRLLGVSNSIVGSIFYAFLFNVAWRGLAQVAFWLSAAACVGSVFLAFILYTKIRSFCVICHAIYAINIGLLISSYWYWKGW